MTQAFNLALLANNINSSGQLNADTGLYNKPIPSGSVFLLYQASAPTGWTQVTSLNDYALRIVSSTGGTTGGTSAFSSVFTNQTVNVSGTIGATTLSTSQMPSHSHTTKILYAGDVEWLIGWDDLKNPNDVAANSNNATNNTGGGGSHTHTFTGSGSSTILLNVQYANIILCSKN